MLDGVCDFPRMRARNFGHRVRLSYDKKVLHFTDVIFRVVLDRVSESIMSNNVGEQGSRKQGAHFITRKSVG